MSLSASARHVIRTERDRAATRSITRLDGAAPSPLTPAEQIRTDMSPTRSISSRQTDDDLAARAHEWAERTAIEQGLPIKIDNPLILKKVAEILWPQDKKGDQT